MTMRVSYPFMETRHKLLWSMMYTAGDIVIVMDKDGDVVFTNRNFETEFNKRANRGLFENIRTFMPELTFALKYSEGARGARQRDTARQCQRYVVFLLHTF